MVFNAPFNNISVISWWSVLLVEETEKTTDLLQVTDKLYRIKLHQIHLANNSETQATLGQDIEKRPTKQHRTILCTFCRQEDETSEQYYVLSGYLTKTQQITIIKSLVGPNLGSTSQFIALKVSMITITTDADIK
jgi:hypothetical protein